MLLLEESWRDLFLISLAQTDVSFDGHQMTLLADESASSTSSVTAPSSLSSSSCYIGYVRDLVKRIQQLHLDNTEYTCIKALAIFRPGAFVAFLV